MHGSGLDRSQLPITNLDLDANSLTKTVTEVRLNRIGGDGQGVAIGLLLILSLLLSNSMQKVLDNIKTRRLIKSMALRQSETGLGSDLPSAGGE